MDKDFVLWATPRAEGEPAFAPFGRHERRRDRPAFSSRQVDPFRPLLFSSRTRLLVSERRGTMIIYGLIVSVYEEVDGAIVELLGAVAKRTPSGKRRRGYACELAN